jgi:hypothetical protein
MRAPKKKKKKQKEGIGIGGSSTYLITLPSASSCAIKSTATFPRSLGC